MAKAYVVCFNEQYCPPHNYNLFKGKEKHLTKWCTKKKANIMLSFILHNFMHFEGVLQQCIQKNRSFIFGS